LFVYGTLQDARVRDHALRGVAARVIGRGSVRGALYHLDDYPGLVASDDDARVPGILLELDDAAAWEALDRYEGVDEGLYVRRQLAVTLDDGQTRDAWVYLYAQPITGRRRIAAWPV
jgi:gamma-glutamylcyclotransferase (GGCT)/AIG2-like uncharacterized protein YtfP